MTSNNQQLDEQYRDDVREILEAEGWRETAEDCVVADNGALWTETNSALDSGVDAPDKSWSVAFDSNVPTHVIAAVALVAAGTDLVAEVRRLRAAMEQIRHLHKDSPMGPCPVCIDADAIAEGRDGLMPYPCPTGRLAGAQDCEPAAPAARSAAV